MQRVLLTDIDNTLFSWIDYFGPCFRALVHAVAREAELPEAELYASFRLLFQREGTVEYKKAIQENVLIQSMPSDKQELLIRYGSVAFGKASRRNMRPYPSVVPTLRRLRQDGVHVVAVTNSGALQAMYRVQRMGLSRLLDGLVAWDHDVTGAIEAEEDYSEALARRLKWSGLPWVAALSVEQLKPNVAAYEEALARLKIVPTSVWVLGDSLAKDLSAAPLLPAKSVWARYGHRFEPRNFETLLRVTHWSEDRIKFTYDTAVLQPDYVAEDFADLLRIIDLRQPSLF